MLILSQRVSMLSVINKDLFAGADDPTKVYIICDILALPSFLEDAVIKNITQGLASNQLDNISFLLD